MDSHAMAAPGGGFVGMDGIVTELTGDHYHVRLDMGCAVIAVLSLWMGSLPIAVKVGDRVSVNVSISDLTQEMVLYRHANRAAG